MPGWRWRAPICSKAWRSSRDAFLFDARDIRDFGVSDLLLQGLLLGVPAILTLAVPVILVTLLTQLGFGRGRWVLDSLEQGQRINPLSGLKRMFGAGADRNGQGPAQDRAARQRHGGGTAWKP